HHRWSLVFTHSEGIAVKPADSARLVVQTRQALYEYSLKNSQLRQIEIFPEDFDHDVERLGHLVRSNGEIWVFRRSIRVYDANGHFCHHIMGRNEMIGTLPSNPILVMYESMGGVIWVGTNAFGLTMHSPNTTVFSYIGNQSASPVEISNSTIWDVLSEDDQKIFLLTLDALDVVNVTTRKTQTIPIVGSDGKKTYGNKLFKDGRNRVWVCTKKGLMVFEGSRLRIVDDEILGDPGTNVFSCTSLDSIQYIVTTNRGIFMWNTDTNVSRRIAQWISRPVKYYKGLLWLDKGSQIVRINPNGFTPYDSIQKGSGSHQLPNAPIKSFFEDRDGVLWIGSWGGGLTKYDTDKESFKSYGQSAGVHNMVIYMIQEDNDGMLWLSTNQGLLLFDKASEKVVRYFEVEDGIQGNEFNTNSGHKSSKGTLYFGGINGLTFFDPREVKRTQVKIPRAVILAVYIDNQQVDQPFASIPSNTDVLEIGWQQKNFSIDVSALGFSLPKKIRIQYKLEEYADDWTSLDDNRRITFTNLPAGTYRLRVRAANPNGVWEEPGLVLTIVVERPLWERSLFWLAVSVLAILSSFSFHLLRTISLRKRNKILSNLVNQRTADLIKLNKEIQLQNEMLNKQAVELARQFHELELTRNEQEKIITERTQEILLVNESLIQHNSQLEQFAFITSHNIRGPIARIKGLLNIITIHSTEIDHLRKSADQLEQLVTDLSVILKIRKGTEVHRESVNLLSQLNGVIEILTPEIKESKAVLDLANFSNERIESVHAYITSIFYNLLSNAIKYRHPMRSLSISCACKRKGDRVEITFSDNGVGIDMRYAAGKIFTLYQRFHPDRPGRGLGLYMVKNQIEMLRGAIHVETEVNSGTTFVVSLPTS
ncbi:MAG: ATP-binding protein, partial [Bacteroidota bacterium]